MGVAHARVRDGSRRAGKRQGRVVRATRTARRRLTDVSDISASAVSRATTIRTITGAIFVATIVGCGLSLAIALLAVRLDAAGFSARAIGINTAAGGVATLLSAPLIPWIARRFGVARALMLSLVMGGLALVGFTFSDDYLVWLILRFVIGAAVTIEFVLSEYWITTRAPEGRRGLAIGLYATSLAIGFAVGPLILTWVGTSGNVPFYLGAALFIGAAGPLALNARGAPPLEIRSGKSLLAFVREAPAATLAALMQGAIEVAGLSLLPVYALRSGLDARDGALFASAFILGNSAFQLPLGALSDKLDPRKMLAALALFGGVGAVGLGLAGVGTTWIFELLLLAWGGTVGALYPVGLSHLAMLYRGPDLASANAAFVMAYAIGMLGGPPLIGAGLDRSPAGFFWVIAAMLVVYLAIAGAQMVRGRPRIS